ncbi:nicotinate-nucleotide--dimethylbenzimidazole phosphoribosyltransferase [Sphingomonas sp. PR090111-T3T-6A]|uniref:nicotinate-nucleotide--dimethylbenzimidazole phosphoribosyltransferase n=1 Tax=Sphingomonas sp. PR090111-T3T-6A TaxID=685778 RepID=UPI00036289AE|nr:nicotinate-nucleotide--dimethylbenzimidazole phosphoribosyltransferase [Sphingomonas sp. PR090111-T3T-6A]
MNGFASIPAFELALASLPEHDPAALAAARARQAELTKPPGSLGRLEDIACFLASWQGCSRPHIDHGRVLVFAGNHGVTSLGVSAYPADVTRQMVANFEAGGAAINALARAAGLHLKVIALDLDRPTADFTEEPAMSVAECLDALSAGAAAVEDGLDLIVVGEMGIGNSTAAAALSACSFGGEADEWVGPGTGVDRHGLARKAAVVTAGIATHLEAATSAFEILRRLGGREIAAIAGAVIAARHKRIPVVLDGFISCSALAPLARHHPAITAHCIAGHQSAEPGHARLLAELGLSPLLRLDMRLGEGSGAAVAVNLIRAALAAHNDMATFAEAGVSTSA